MTCFCKACSFLCTQYLVGFCMNYSINAAWHGGNQPVALLRCNGSPGWFDSGRKEAWSALKFPGRCCIDCGLQKTQRTETSRWHGSPNHHRLWKLHTGLQATLILCLSTLPPDSGTLISKWNAKFTFIWKEDFGPLRNSPVIFLLSQGKMLFQFFKDNFSVSEVAW